MTVEQGELALTRRPTGQAIPQHLIWAQKSASSAISMACQASGLEDKEIYLSLGIDAGHWSRIRKGEAHFPVEKMGEFCRVVENRVLPEWVAYQVGCGLVMLKSEARANDLAERLKYAEKLLAGREVTE